MQLIEDFQPPDGTRTIWHSPKFQQLWEPRVRQIATGQTDRERQSVLLGIRGLCLQPVSRGFDYERLTEWARNHNLSLMPVRAVGRFDGFAHRYTQGEDMYVTAIAAKPEYAEDPQPEKWLGYPECCQKFFAANFPKYIDPMWQWSGERESVQASPYSNPLLRYVSLRFCPHIPCSPQCEPSIELGMRFAELMTEEERDWLLEMFLWPIEWSCLHGVAEVHTPAFRVVIGSNPSVSKYTVSCQPLQQSKTQ